MDFDLNDPLGDILSDDSNDSFFNDDKYKSASKAKAAPASNIEAKKSNLFGLEDKSATVKEQNNDDLIKSKKSGSDWLGLSESKPATPSDARKTETKTIGSVNVIQNPKIDKTALSMTEIIAKPIAKKSENLDFLDEFDSFLDSDKGAKSSLNLNDLLGKTTAKVQKNVDTPSVQNTIKKETSFSYAPTTGTQVKDKNVTIKSIKSDALVKEQSKYVEQKLKDDDKASGVPRRTKSKDWLGILDDGGADILSTDKTDNPKSFSELLNLSEKKEKAVKESIAVEAPKVEKQTEDKPKQEQKESMMNQTQLQMDVNDFLNKMTVNLDTNMVGNLGGNMNIEQQGAALCLQQQESHLMVALQLKAQEERLAAMHERQSETKRIQREVASGQREQLNRILQGQVNHRAQLQQVIEQHQQRINKHIQSLLKPDEVEDDVNASENYSKSYNKTDLNDGENRKVEFLRSQLEQITSILKDYHEKEIELIENCYRRQIVFANNSLLIVEERYKIENEKLVEFYNVKLKKLEDDYIHLQEQSDDVIKSIMAKHLSEVEKLESKHLKDIETLQQQHHIVIQNIRDSIELEHSTVKEAKNYTQHLDNIMLDVNKNNELCLKIVKKLENNIDSSVDARQKALEAKEEQIDRLLDNLEIQRKVYESEINKKNLFLQSFEERMKQEMQIIEEDKAAFKQKQQYLENETESIKLDYERLKKQHQMERDSFQKNVAFVEKSNEDAKSNIEEQYRKLDAEKLIVTNEKKSVLEMKANCQLTKSKLDNELQDLKDRKLHMEREQEKLYQDEAKIVERSRELEMLTQTALAKQKNADNKMSEAIFMKQKYDEKFGSIQEHSLSLNAREQQIASDKMSLSRERLSLYNQRAESGYEMCSVCRSSIVLQKEPKNDNVLKYQEPNPEILFNLNAYRSDLLDLNMTKDLIKDNLIDINNDDMYSNKIKRVEKF